MIKIVYTSFVTLKIKSKILKILMKIPDKAVGIFLFQHQFTNKHLFTKKVKSYPSKVVVKIRGLKDKNILFLVILVKEIPT